MRLIYNTLVTTVVKQGFLSIPEQVNEEWAKKFNLKP